MTIKIQKLMIAFGFSILIIGISLFCGCTQAPEDSSVDSSNNEVFSLVGNWSMIDDTYDTSFKIFYKFFDNSSFFTGVQNMSSMNFDSMLWGTYTLSDSRINMSVDGYNSTSSLQYSFDDEGKKLLLYYEDDINFDILTRES